MKLTLQGQDFAIYGRHLGRSVTPQQRDPHSPRYFGRVQCTVFPMRGTYILLQARCDTEMVFYYFDRTQIGTGEIAPVEFLCYEWSEYTFSDT